MKRFLYTITVIALFFVFAGCGETSSKNDEDQKDDVDVVDVDDTDEGDTGDSGDDGNTGNTGDTCTLDSEWMQPEDAWTSWAYLKMMGPIGDYDGEYAAAVFTDGKIKLTSGTTDFADGSYMNYQSQILLADAAAYEFTDVDQAAGTAVVDYWDAMYQFSLQLIPLMIEEGANSAGFGATVTFRHTYIDVEFDASGAVTSQEVRKNCYLAVSNTEEMEEEGETYDVPIGDIFGCVGDNTDASVGEDLKMMFKNDMTEDQTALLEFFNTQTDGSVLAYGDEGFQHLCMCYEADGTEVDCWAYDGPGGAEECPDYVSEEDCKVPVTDEMADEMADEMTDEVVVDEMADEMTDEVVVDEMADEMTDEVVVDEMADEMTDEVVVDEDVVTTPCDPNPCTAMANSDGACTIDGTSYSCGCDSGYMWVDGMMSCQMLPPAPAQVPNGIFDSWTGTPEMPENWELGHTAPASTVISKVDRGSGNFALNIKHDPDSGNKYVLATTPFAVSDVAPTKITFDLKIIPTEAAPVLKTVVEYVYPEMSLNLECGVAPYDYTTDVQLFYNWDSTTKTFLNEGTNQYRTIETGTMDFLATEITLGAEIAGNWIAGNECRVYFKSGSTDGSGANFDVTIDNVIVH